MGFPTPINQWFQSDLRDFVFDTFSSQKARQRDYMDSKKVVKQIDQEGIYSRKIWGLLSLELSHKKFIN